MTAIKTKTVGETPFRFMVKLLWLVTLAPISDALNGNG
jgi:hypothetical protein